MNETNPRRVLTYAGRAGDLVQALRDWAPDPRLPLAKAQLAAPKAREEKRDLAEHEAKRGRREARA